MKKIGVALLGLGTVGGGTYRILKAMKEDIMRTDGVEIEVLHVLERDVEKAKDALHKNDCVVSVTKVIGVEIPDDEIENLRSVKLSHKLKSMWQSRKAFGNSFKLTLVEASVAQGNCRQKIFKVVFLASCDVRKRKKLFTVCIYITVFYVNVNVCGVFSDFLFREQKRGKRLWGMFI